MFTAFFEIVPATPEFKLLQLRQYFSGEALKTIEGLGHFGFAYAKQRKRDLIVSLVASGVKSLVILKSW